MMVAVWIVLGAILAQCANVIRYRMFRGNIPKKGYAITYATLNEASLHYCGEGVIVRLDLFGPEPLTAGEINRAGSQYLEALKRLRRRNEALARLELERTR